ncbi:penicillin-insensitive murein endopeptidase [Roseicyclus marinus]|uniref:penicillin-insensitive murein endopeptidase n=1 Tax=Roseicyclus marinus TaxID=2161673 RepID=UPI00240E9D8D|nr:penicillin-insensitive murein endopeptidase [Roseicyclus marinus]MDG3041202.1 penicillin-insensitive murein endopeptidase [Roseicyclus marinus]
MRILPGLAVAAVALVVGCMPVRDEAGGLPPLDATVSGQEARLLFGAERGASSGTPEVIGGYSRGCLAGAERLAETGPTWAAMRLSRNRNWGHPELVDYVQDLSARVAAETAWRGLYVGDMSQPRGGPMLSGHVSHQSGLDVDIWMLPPTRFDLSAAERENLSSISTRSAGGARVGENWTQAHMEVMRLAASDPRVARIFVFPGAKVWMCDNATGDRSWLRNIRPAAGHHYHFHVRLSCPAGSTGCVNQDPPPPGDGCAEAREWAANILNPPPPDPDYEPPPPRGPLTLGELPRQCAALLGG